jgi:hypothetical protein
MDIFRDDIRQGSILGLIPNILDRVEVRGIRRQPFHVQPRSAALQQSSGSRTMSAQAIPHEDDWTPQMIVNFSHEPDEILRPRVVIQKFIVQSQPGGPRRSRNRSHRRDPIVAVPGALERCAAQRGPHTPPQRLQQIPTFIEKYQASLSLEALFLVAAKFRDASERCPPRSVLGHAVPASADSSQVGAATAARSPDENSHRIIAGSCPAPGGRSSHRARIPNNVCPETTPPPIRSAGARRASVFYQDVAGTAACCRASMPFSSDAPKKHWNQ